MAQHHDALNLKKRKESVNPFRLDGNLAGLNMLFLKQLTEKSLLYFFHTLHPLSGTEALLHLWNRIVTKFFFTMIQTQRKRRGATVINFWLGYVLKFVPTSIKCIEQWKLNDIMAWLQASRNIAVEEASWKKGETSSPVAWIPQQASQTLQSNPNDM